MYKRVHFLSNAMNNQFKVHSDSEYGVVRRNGGDILPRFFSFFILHTRLYNISIYEKKLNLILKTYSHI